MQLSDIFLGLGQENFNQLLRSISFGRLKTFQMYERLKTRLHLQKLNTEGLRKASDRLWQRLSERDDEYASDISQSVLVSQIELIKAVLDSLEVPHDSGFFMKDVDTASYLKEGWQQAAFDQFKGKYSDAVLLFYINHLAWEVQKAETVFIPAA